MLTQEVLAAWAQPLRQASQRPPQRPRDLLWCNGLHIGSVEPGLLADVGASVAVQAVGGALVRQSLHAQDASWHLTAADPTAVLNALAQWLRQHGHCGPWRNEQLDVGSVQGQWCGTVERGAVRVLGIATQAVHLLGLAPDGRMWVQQRAHNKPTHPGQWDTLMGGMVSAGDSLQAALARETLEEAGLDVAQLHALRHGGHVDFVCPSEEGGDGVGYMQERIHWFQATVPAGMVPQNMDGEVAQFQCMALPQLLQWLVENRFTPEASLILADYLGLGY